MGFGHRIVFFLIIFILSGCSGFMFQPQQRITVKARLVHDPLDMSRFPVYRSDRSDRELVLHLLRKYYPDGFHIVQREEAMTKHQGVRRIGAYARKGFMVMVHGKGKRAVLDGLGTIVHEDNHGYTSKYPRRYFRIFGGRPYYFRGYGYYIGKGKSVIVPFTRGFPAREIRHIFPPALMKKRMYHFRYDTYIHPSSTYQSTQVHGVYGLLDELNSYYHGCRANLEMLPFYKSSVKLDSRKLVRYFMNVNGTRYAYYEFKLFILLYMRYAREHYPEIYRAIMNNRPFLLAFLRIEENFRRLQIRYRRLLGDFDNWLQKRGFHVDESATSIYIKKNEGRSGTIIGYGHFGDVIRAHEKELNRPANRAIMETMRQEFRKGQSVEKPSGKV